MSEEGGFALCKLLPSLYWLSARPSMYMPMRRTSTTTARGSHGGRAGLHSNKSGASITGRGSHIDSIQTRRSMPLHLVPGYKSICEWAIVMCEWTTVNGVTQQCTRTGSTFIQMQKCLCDEMQ